MMSGRRQAAGLVFGGTRMSGRTKLYQKPGSPLIQGNSKMHSSFWRVLFAALAFALLITWLVIFLFFTLTAPESGLSFVEHAISALVSSVTVGAVGILIGTWFGVLLARGMGWSRPALSAGVIGALFALLSFLFAMAALGWTMTAP